MTILQTNSLKKYYGSGDSGKSARRRFPAD